MPRDLAKKIRSLPHYAIRKFRLLNWLDVVEYDRGPDVHELLPAGEPVKYEIPEVPGAGHRHVHQDILVAGDHEHAERLGQLRHIVPHRLDSLPRLGPDPYRDQRLHTPAERRQIR